MKYPLLFTILFAASPSHAQQRLEMEGTAVIGNRELPKILYIVPWKNPEPIAMDAPEYDSVLDQPMQPIERDSFRRRINYFGHIYPDSNAEQPQ